MTPIGWLLVLGWLAAVASVAAAVYTARGWPIGVRSLASDLGQRMDALETRWAALHRDVKAFLDAIEEQAETIDRRRARVEAAAHRARAREQQQQPEANPADDREALRVKARARGFQV